MGFFSKAFDWFANLSNKLPKISFKTYFIIVVAVILGVCAIIALTFLGSRAAKLKSACKKIIKFLSGVESINDDNVGIFNERCFSEKAPQSLRDTWLQYDGVRFGYPSEIVSEQAVYNREVRKLKDVRSTVFIAISLILLAVFAFWGYGTLASNEMGVIHLAGLALTGVGYLILVLIYRGQIKSCLNTFEAMQEELDVKVSLQIEKNFATDSSPLANLASIMDEIIGRNTLKDVGNEETSESASEANEHPDGPVQSGNDDMDDLPPLTIDGSSEEGEHDGSSEQVGPAQDADAEIMDGEQPAEIVEEPSAAPEHEPVEANVGETSEEAVEEVSEPQPVEEPIQPDETAEEQADESTDEEQFVPEEEIAEQQETVSEQDPEETPAYEESSQAVEDETEEAPMEDGILREETTEEWNEPIDGEQVAPEDDIIDGQEPEEAPVDEVKFVEEEAETTSSEEFTQPDEAVEEQTDEQVVPEEDIIEEEHEEVAIAEDEPSEETSEQIEAEPMEESSVEDEPEQMDEPQEDETQIGPEPTESQTEEENDEPTAVEVSGNEPQEQRDIAKDMAEIFAEPEVVYSVDSVDEDAGAKPSKLIKLPNLVDYILSSSASPSMLINITKMLMNSYPKYEDNPEDREILKGCLAKLADAIKNGK